jgi:hypothetical protein
MCSSVSMSRFGLNELSCLDCAWMSSSCNWAKGRYHCECLAYVAFMGEHKLLFATKALHVPWNELILKRSVYAWKMLHPSCLCLNCLIFHIWVQNMLHDVHQWRSLHEVDTWLMSFDMTCFALWVFSMIFCWEFDILVWSLSGMHVCGSSVTWIGFYMLSEHSFGKTA